MRSAPSRLARVPDRIVPTEVSPADCRREGSISLADNSDARDARTRPKLLPVVMFQVRGDCTLLTMAASRPDPLTSVAQAACRAPGHYRAGSSAVGPGVLSVGPTSEGVSISLRFARSVRFTRLDAGQAAGGRERTRRFDHRDEWPRQRRLGSTHGAASWQLAQRLFKTDITGCHTESILGEHIR